MTEVDYKKQAIETETKRLKALEETYNRFCKESVEFEDWAHRKMAENYEKIDAMLESIMSGREYIKKCETFIQNNS